MAGRECYHSKQWVEEGEEHDCWTTTETALTQDLSEEVEAPITDWLREAYELSDVLASSANTIRANSTPKPRPKLKKAKSARKGAVVRKSKRR
jgi:hypothetical protein